VRVRLVVPGPQLLEQTDHGVHKLALQGTGQGSDVQLIASIVCGQLPPFRAGLVTLRVRTLLLGPQVAEQPDQADHAATVQSTGHGMLLHGPISMRLGQRVPPGLLGTSSGRKR
jgi:hypothetical protein